MASIQRRGTNSFLLVVETGYSASRKRIKKTKTIRVEDQALLKTKKKLSDYLNDELVKFKMEVEAGEYIAPEKLTLKDFIIDWENKYAVKELGPQTLYNYLGYLKNHILPLLGHLRLDQVKPIDVINFLNDIQRKDGKEKPLSSSTIKYIYRVLRNVFERATDWKIIKHNPVSDVKRPKEDNNREVNVYSEEEVESLFRSVQNDPFHWRVFISLALAAGLRRGELLGLEWKDVDLEKGLIHIRQAIVKGVGEKPVIKKPKTKKSIRTVSLPPSITVELKKYYEHWQIEREVYGYSEAGERQFVFCNLDGSHFYPTTPSTWWRRFTKREKVRYIRLHDLRHTSATLLINKGVHAKIISERLGHADIRITMDTYGHALQTADAEAAQKLDDIFSSRKN